MTIGDIVDTFRICRRTIVDNATKRIADRGDGMFR